MWFTVASVHFYLLMANVNKCLLMSFALQSVKSVKNSNNKTTELLLKRLPYYVKQSIWFNFNLPYLLYYLNILAVHNYCNAPSINLLLFFIISMNGYTKLKHMGFGLCSIMNSAGICMLPATTKKVLCIHMKLN